MQRREHADILRIAFWGENAAADLFTPMRTAFFLRNVTVLAGLSDELLGRLAEEVREVRIPAGSWILREGERADSMFAVSGGRIEVVHEGPPEILLRVLRRGDVLGELALLRDGVRAASARAQRDTELLELGRAEFEHDRTHARRPRDHAGGRRHWSARLEGAKANASTRPGGCAPSALRRARGLSPPGFASPAVMRRGDKVDV